MYFCSALSFRTAIKSAKIGGKQVGNLLRPAIVILIQVVLSALHSERVN